METCWVSRSYAITRTEFLSPMLEYYSFLDTRVLYFVLAIYFEKKWRFYLCVLEVSITVFFMFVLIDTCMALYCFIYESFAAVCRWKYDRMRYMFVYMHVNFRNQFSKNRKKLPIPYYAVIINHINFRLEHFIWNNICKFILLWNHFTCKSSIIQKNAPS